MKKRFITSFVALFACGCVLAQSNEVSRRIKVIDSLMYAHQGELAIPMIDSLLKDNLEASTQLHLKAFKLEALIQVQKLESAFNLSNQLLEDSNLKGQALMRTYIERALLFEHSKEMKQSKKALDFVEAYYKDDKHPRDEFYGEYLYRMSSWYNI